MKWIAISGSWRTTSPEVELEVRTSVADILQHGDGIVTGGALGVDYIATKEAMLFNPDVDRIKVFLPTTLRIYAEHYRNRAREGVITAEQAEALIEQLTTLQSKRRRSLVEMGHTILNEQSYYDRNSQVLHAADELLAFSVNNSLGVQDAIDKAKNLGMAVTAKHYTYTA